MPIKFVNHVNTKHKNYNVFITTIDHQIQIGLRIISALAHPTDELKSSHYR